MLLSGFVFCFVLFFSFLAVPRGMWDLSPLTRDRTHAPCIGSEQNNHWTAREVPGSFCFFTKRDHQSLDCHLPMRGTECGM